MSEIVQFPGAVAPADHPIIDRRHAEAFRDLEPGICDCATMAKIAAQMMLEKDDGTDRELVFAVCHVSEMLTALKAGYYAAYNEKQPVAAP
jgi:hypothetical protein